MSYMKKLDEIIQYKVGYIPAEYNDNGMISIPAVNESSYQLMLDEINQCVSSEVPEEQRLSFEQLSPIAQDIIREWESLIESEHNIYAEQPEDY